MKHFEGYPLCAVRNGNRVVIWTHNAVAGQATPFATTDTDERALAIVNKMNFFDDILEALKDAHPYISVDDRRIRIGKIINTATGGE